MIFSDELINALLDVSNQISPDSGTTDPLCIAELCVDADRLSSFGHPEAQEEARSLINEHGYDEFLKEAANHVYY